ncbi:CaiB/BaiF CoA transferase family protein [Caulobacter sp. KR2-114]|uniref:CaiB/BaiF CoA transferase family protein n=1 Tax=Caulobacter sp. KR2-114 TaxID=3400912 RepID=UPI003C00B916
MLEGLKVVEFSTYVAGPSAAMVMADWGAEVIKVESRSGDPTRHTFSASPHLKHNPVFEFENRGKRGVVLDISKPGGRDALVRILKDADIFITNLRPRALKRAKLDFASVHAELPRLIYCNVTGYGLEGEAADMPAFDIAAFWSRGGVASSTIPRGVEPFPIGPGVGDEICALATVSAALAAVNERARTGVGRQIETSLLRTGVFANGWNTAIQLRFGKVAATRSRRELFNPLSNYWPTADGTWVCTVTRHGADDWAGITSAAGLPQLMEDPRFATPRDRTQNAAALIDALDDGFSKLSLAEVGARLTAGDVIWAPMQNPGQVAGDPWAQAAGCFTEVEEDNGERYLAPAGPARLPGQPESVKRTAPGLGQHTRQVLAEAGYSAAEIEALIADGSAV